MEIPDNFLEPDTVETLLVVRPLTNGYHVIELAQTGRNYESALHAIKAFTTHTINELEKKEEEGGDA